MSDWVKLVIYLSAFIMSALILFGVKWNNIMRPTHTVFSVLLYVLCALALGYLVGSFIITLAELKPI